MNDCADTTNEGLSCQASAARRALEALTPQDFLAFGVDRVAYIKPIAMNGVEVWSIHAADGTPLSVFSTAQEAVHATRQNELMAVRLH